MASELTRAQLQAAVDDFDARGTMADYRHLHFLAQAGRELLAMRPATDVEIYAATVHPFIGTSDNWERTLKDWRAAEARLLPFADDPATPAPTETR